MSRRAAGEGSIYKERKRLKRLKDGREAVYWRAELVTGWTAKGKKVLRKSFKTRAEAAVWLAEQVAAKNRGQLPVEPSRQTVEGWLGRWLRDVAALEVRPTTLEVYARQVRHITPTIGRIPLVKLTPAHVQTMVTEVAKSGLSARSVQLVYVTLHRALEVAVRLRLIATNPCNAVVRPKAERPELRVLSAEEARRFLEAAQEDRYAALWHLLLSRGLRIGEALGLTWDHIDLDGGRLEIVQQLMQPRAEEEASGWRRPRARRAGAPSLSRRVTWPPCARTGSARSRSFWRPASARAGRWSS
ncbi:MAG: tyrosine-type recombinase/integrase [Bacillota bacterium]|nr:tyrosine-type recombinase/integrase [Bacillota bacterium]